MKHMSRAVTRLLSLCLLLPLLAMLGAPAMAESVDTAALSMTAVNMTGVIRNPNGGSYVNVRAWPSYDADILSRLSVGASVTITGTSGTWYSVWVNGVVGYINSNFVTVSGGGGSGGGTWTDQNATVRSGPLNVREAPTMQARVITQLATGTRVEAVSNDGTWTQIRAAQIIGYVVSSYLTFDGQTNPTPPSTNNANATIRTTNGGNLNLRQTGSSSASILGSYPNGYRVRVITAGSVWHYVQAGDQYGYMSAQFIVRDGGSGGGGSTGSGYDAVVNNPGSAQLLNLRAEPSTNSRSLGQYRNGQYVRVLGVGTDWLRVNVDGVVGYMMTKYVRITGSGATANKTISGGAGGFVNVRSGPGYDYSIIKRINNGDPATVVIPYPLWSQVLIRDGSGGYQSGYILNTFLK